jgi:hypothetical protein
VRAFTQIGHEWNGIFFPQSPAPPGGPGASLDQAFATLMLPGETWTMHPLSAGAALGGADLALPDYLSDPGSGAGQLQPARDLTSGSAGHSAEETATVVDPARERAFELASDPEGASLVTDLGLHDGDIRVN